MHRVGGSPWVLELQEWGCEKTPRQRSSDPKSAPATIPQMGHSTGWLQRGRWHRGVFQAPSSHMGPMPAIRSLGGLVIRAHGVMGWWHFPGGHL